MNKWEQGEPKLPPLADPMGAFGAVGATDLLVEIPQFPEKIQKEHNECSQYNNEEDTYKYI